MRSQRLRHHRQSAERQEPPNDDLKLILPQKLRHQLKLNFPLTTNIEA